MVTDCTFWWPVIAILTAPPPAVPSTVSLPNSSCALSSFSCIWWRSRMFCIIRLFLFRITLDSGNPEAVFLHSRVNDRITLLPRLAVVLTAELDPILELHRYAVTKHPRETLLDLTPHPRTLQGVAAAGALEAKGYAVGTNRHRPAALHHHSDPGLRELVKDSGPLAPNRRQLEGQRALEILRRISDGLRIDSGHRLH